MYVFFGNHLQRYERVLNKTRNRAIKQKIEGIAEATPSRVIYMS